MANARTIVEAESPKSVMKRLPRTWSYAVAPKAALVEPNTPGAFRVILRHGTELVDYHDYLDTEEEAKQLGQYWVAVYKSLEKAIPYEPSKWKRFMDWYQAAYTKNKGVRFEIGNIPRWQGEAESPKAALRAQPRPIEIIIERLGDHKFSAAAQAYFANECMALGGRPSPGLYVSARNIQMAINKATEDIPVRVTNLPMSDALADHISVSVNEGGSVGQADDLFNFPRTMMQVGDDPLGQKVVSWKLNAPKELLAYLQRPEDQEQAKVLLAKYGSDIELLRKYDGDPPVVREAENPKNFLKQLAPRGARDEWALVQTIPAVNEPTHARIASWHFRSVRRPKRWFKLGKGHGFVYYLDIFDLDNPISIHSKSFESPNFEMAVIDAKALADSFLYARAYNLGEAEDPKKFLQRLSAQAAQSPAGIEMNFGFAIMTPEEYEIEESAEALGLELDQPAWDQLNTDIAQLERNGLAILGKLDIRASDEGHDGEGDLIGSAWTMSTSKGWQVIKEVAAGDDNYIWDVERLRQLAYPGVEIDVWNGISALGKQVLELRYEFFDHNNMFEAENPKSVFKKMQPPQLPELFVRVIAWIRNREDPFTARIRVAWIKDAVSTGDGWEAGISLIHNSPEMLPNEIEWDDWRDLIEMVQYHIMEGPPMANGETDSYDFLAAELERNPRAEHPVILKVEWMMLGDYQLAQQRATMAFGGPHESAPKSAARVILDEDCAPKR